MLRELRFQSARVALLAASADQATVADIATACGFFELGHFAVEYRQRYAETPSETLRRQSSSGREPAPARPQ